MKGSGKPDLKHSIPIQGVYRTTMNYFDNRSTNASAESFNAKIKAFRTQFRGVKNVEFFLYRLTQLYA